MEATFSKDRGIDAPSVTVCMICYNQENFVGQAIAGVIDQQCDFPVELLIGEDCSTDGTRMRCKEAAARYPDKVRLLPSCSNMGVIPNFLRTLSFATGKYVALCEGDDYWCDPGKLQKQVDWLERHPECGLVYSQVRWYFDREQRFDRNWGGPGSGETTLERLLESNCIPTPSVVIRRDLLNRYIEEVRPQERDWLMGDYPVWLYAAARSKIRFIDEPMAVYRILNESASHFRDFGKADRFCRSTLDIRRCFAERYAPQLLPQIEERSLWERFGFAVHYKDPRAAFTLYEQIRERGAAFDTKERQALRRRMRRLAWRHPILWLKRKP